MANFKDGFRVWVLTMKVDWDIPNIISIAMDRVNEWDWARTMTDMEPKTRHMSPRLPFLMTNPIDALETMAKKYADQGFKFFFVYT